MLSSHWKELPLPAGLYTGRPAQELVLGIDGALTRLREQRDGLQTDLTSGSTTRPILGELLPVRDMPPSDALELGVFAQDEVHYSGTPWTLIPALRVDYYRLRPRFDAIYREDNPGTAAVGLEHVSLAPKLGVTYRFADAVTAYFQYAHGFRSPPPEDVNIGLEVPLFNIRAIPNPDLRPETSDGFETGLRLAGSPVALTASVFLTEYGDFIESKVNLGVDPATGVTLFQSQNVAEARIYGAEFDARVEGSTWSPRLQGWSGRLAGSWIRGDDLTRDVPLNSIDPPRLVLSVRYDAPSTRWGSERALTAAEAQRQVDRSRADLYRTDG